MRVFFIVLGLIGVVCAARRQSRIVGGEDARIEDYPFMAGMLGNWYEGRFHLGCGATLISTTSVVSAAHCFEGEPAPSIRVRLGTVYDKHGGIEHIVSRIIIHPQYNPDNLSNDIRVMRLRDPAVYTDQIKSARIAGPRYHLPAGTVVYTAGWGDIQYGGPHSEILQHVAVNVIDHQTCLYRYENPIRRRDHKSDLHYVTPEMLCTGILDVGGKDSCTGDSGGPVVHNGDVLVGIVSTGPECGHPYYPAVNTRVSSFANWIYENSVN